MGSRRNRWDFSKLKPTGVWFWIQKKRWDFQANLDWNKKHWGLDLQKWEFKPTNNGDLINETYTDLFNKIGLWAKIRFYHTAQRGYPQQVVSPTRPQLFGNDSAIKRVDDVDGNHGNHHGNHPILKSRIMSELAQFVSDLWISTGATIACCAKRRLKAELQSLEVWWFSSGRLVVSLRVFESSWGRMIEEPAISEVIFLLKVRNSTISEYPPSAGAIAFCWVGWTLGWCGSASQLDLFNYSYGKLGGGFSISGPYDPKEPASFGWSFQLFFHIGKGLELATHHLISLMPRCASLQRWRGGWNYCPGHENGWTCIAATKTVSRNRINY